MNVVGLDLSLTATGVAWPDGHTTTLAFPRLRCAERLDAFYAWAWKSHTPPLCGDAPVDLVVIEGYSFNSRAQGERLGELGGVVRLALHQFHVPRIDVPPATLKLYATGKGNSGKDAVLSAAIRAGADDTVTTNDRADAWWLRAIGLHHLGAPCVPVTDYRVRALGKLEADA